ncbi:hypothetical protein BGZ95_005431, partial [Linnemannia exigua]
MSSSSRPSRSAKANASDKIKDQMDQLLQLTKSHRKGQFNLDLDFDLGLDQGSKSTAAAAAAAATATTVAVMSKRRKRRAADDLSDTEDATATVPPTPTPTPTQQSTTTDGITNADTPKKTRGSRTKKQKSGGDEINKSNNNTRTDKSGVVAEPSSLKTAEAKGKPGRLKKQKAGDNNLNRPDLADSSSLNPIEPNRKPGRPKKLRTDDETTDQARSLTTALKVPARRSSKPMESVYGNDGGKPLASSARDIKHRRQQRQQQEQTVDEVDLHGDSPGSDSKISSSTEKKDDEMSSDDGDDYKDTPKSAQKRASKKDKTKGEAEDGADESKVEKRQLGRISTELEQNREARKERAQHRAQQKQAQLDANAAKVKARDAKILRIARQSYRSIPVSVQLAQAALNIVFQEKQEKQEKQGKLRKHRHKERVEEATGVEWQEDESSFAPNNLIYQVLRPEKREFSYRWPIREELLHTVPVSAFADRAGEPDFFEKQGLGFVEELSGVPKREDDYSDTDMEDNGSGSDQDDRLPKVKEGMRQEDVKKDNKDDQGDESGEETAKERRLRRKRVQAALRSRRLEDIVERQESVPRERHQRHEDERFANARLEAVQNFFDGEMARFAQMQYQKGIPERIQDLDKFQKSTAFPDHGRLGGPSAVFIP